MKILDPRSIIIILIYGLFHLFIIVSATFINFDRKEELKSKNLLSPEFTEIYKVQYFHLKNFLPQMSLIAEKLKSQGEEYAEFDFPQGAYEHQKEKRSTLYKAHYGVYQKEKAVISLKKNVQLDSPDAHYTGDSIRYFFNKDLVTGKGNIKFEGEDLKSHDHLIFYADSMKARPQARLSRFKGQVHGEMKRKKKYEGKTNFSTNELYFDANKSLVNLIGEVHLSRESYDITAEKGDVYLENYNKKLKYFVLNDDVKVVEKLQTTNGYMERRAFAERLEGFGREQKMILTGAPRVEMGKDTIKGYRITIREKVELIEVDDAMSDVEVKKNQN